MKLSTVITGNNFITTISAKLGQVETIAICACIHRIEQNEKSH